MVPMTNAGQIGIPMPPFLRAESMEIAMVLPPSGRLSYETSRRAVGPRLSDPHGREGRPVP
jgi:hypothetical protein